MSKAQYITSKIDNKVYCKTNGQFTRHLKDNILTYQEYYEKYVTKVTPHCGCGKSLTFYQKNHSYANSCGDPICVGKSVSIAKQSWSEDKRLRDSENKKRAASQKSAEQKSAQVAKAKETFRNNHDVEWVTQSSKFKDKSKQTKLTKYGNEYYSNSKKTSESWQAKTSQEIEVIANKRRATCFEKFGVENAFLKPEIKSKSAKSNSYGKDYTLPSGKIIGVRGYEGIVITELLKMYAESEILVDDRKIDYSLPTFNYVAYDEHKRLYYPDIYVHKENKIIEVKSRWWWDANGRNGYEGRLFNNLKKRRSVIDAGYNYEVWLFEDKNNYRILKNDTDFQ